MSIIDVSVNIKKKERPLSFKTINDDTYSLARAQTQLSSHPYISASES
jgi:hypothetical protein